MTDAPHDDLVIDLIVAVLAVNNYSLERAYALVDSLQRERLTDLKAIRQMDPDEVAQCLQRAGYSQAEFILNLFANRLKRVAEDVSDHRLAQLMAHEESGRTELSKELLLQVHGVGQDVLRNFRTLRS